MKRIIAAKICKLFLTFGLNLWLSLGLGLLLPSCSKEGTGGKAIIKGMVMHHDKPISGATVYIKYGSQESPGTDITYYDDHVNADASANFQFVDLKKGDYYLFAVGYDSTIFLTVTGGIPVQLKKKTETVQVSVPVTE